MYWYRYVYTDNNRSILTETNRNGNYLKMIAHNCMLQCVAEVCVVTKFTRLLKSI